MDQAKGSGVTPLYIARESGHSEVVQLLTSAGASVDQADNDSATLSYIACESGHFEVVQLLVSAGVSVDQTTNERGWPLIIADVWECGRVEYSDRRGTGELINLVGFWNINKFYFRKSERALSRCNVLIHACVCHLGTGRARA